MSLKNITNALAYGIARKAITQSTQRTDQYTRQSDFEMLRVAIPLVDNKYKMYYTFEKCPIIKQSLIDMDNGIVSIAATGYPFIVSDDYKTVAIHKGELWAIVTSEEPQTIGGSVQWVKSPFLASPPKGFRCGIKWIEGGAEHA